MKNAPRRGLFALALLALSAMAPGLAQACPQASMPAPSLPHVRAALARQEEILVVTLGSSSTEGWMASDRAHTYPAVLQAELDGALQNAHVAVINRGIGGQDAPEEMARLTQDVIDIRPQLVIWQVGANGAMRGDGPAAFAAEVADGVAKLHEAGADVILMDNQRSPHVLAAPEHAQMEAALAAIAERSGASLFARSKLMDQWQSEGQPYGLFVSADNLHHNDLGYSCVAKALAGSITDALKKPVVVAGLEKNSFFRPVVKATTVKAELAASGR
jgi:acyl-CoA thioesterase I